MKVFGNIAPKWTFTKSAITKGKTKLAGLWIFFQTLDQFSTSNNPYRAEVLKSGCVALKIPWALHPTNDFFYLSFLFYV